MMFKFHFGRGDSISLAARNTKGEETDNVKDAIGVFQKMLPNTVFMLDDEFKRRREAANGAPLSPEREAEIRSAFPSLFGG